MLPFRAEPGAALAAARWGVLALLLVLAAAAGLSLAGAGGGERGTDWARRLTGGDPARAPALMRANGCAGCHTIPGVAGARGTVGPSLEGLAERAFIGGVLPNTADNLVRWISRSRDIAPGTAMPNTLVSDEDARDIAAFLYAR